jgi:hypothetical protein
VLIESSEFPARKTFDVVDCIPKIVDPSDHHPARASRGLHGGDLRQAYRQARRLHCNGPGALNFSTGAAYALLGAMPMIMITGQKGILQWSAAMSEQIRHMRVAFTQARRIRSAPSSTNGGRYARTTEHQFIQMQGGLPILVEGRGRRCDRGFCRYCFAVGFWIDGPEQN